MSNWFDVIESSFENNVLQSPASMMVEFFGEELQR